MMNSPDQIIALMQAEQKVYSAVGKQVRFPPRPTLEICLPPVTVVTAPHRPLLPINDTAVLCH